MRRCRVGVWIAHGRRSERSTPICGGIVPYRPASHAGRERVWGSCGERGQKFGSRWVDQPSQEAMPFPSIRIYSPPTPLKFFDRGGRGRKEIRSSFLSPPYLFVLPEDDVLFKNISSPRGDNVEDITVYSCLLHPTVTHIRSGICLHVDRVLNCEHII